MSAGAPVGLKLVQLLVEVGSGEPVAERVEDVVGGLACVMESGELTTEHDSVEQSRHDGSPGGEPSRLIDGGAACRVDGAGPESDRRPMPFPDRPHAHHKSQAACRCCRLVGMRDDAGITQRRTFDRVLAGECRA